MQPNFPPSSSFFIRTPESSTFGTVSASDHLEATPVTVFLRFGTVLGDRPPQLMELDSEEVEDCFFDLHRRYGVTSTDFREALETGALSSRQAPGTPRSSIRALPPPQAILDRISRSSSESSAMRTILSTYRRGGDPLLDWAAAHRFWGFVRVDAVPLDRGIVDMETEAALALVFPVWSAKSGPWIPIAVEEGVELPQGVTVPGCGQVREVTKTLTTTESGSFLRQDGHLKMHFKHHVLSRWIHEGRERRKGKGKGREEEREGEEERLPGINTVIVWARASKSDPTQGTIGSIFRQVLTMVGNPPPPIQRDWRNVGNVIVLEEVCSAYKHTLADRLAYVRARGPLQDGALVLTTSPERMTRHGSDLSLLPLSQLFSLNLQADPARWSSWESSRDKVEESLRLGNQLSRQQGLYSRHGRACSRFLDQGGGRTGYLERIREAMRVWADEVGLRKWILVARISPEMNPGGLSLQDGSRLRQLEVLGSLLPQDEGQRERERVSFQASAFQNPTAVVDLLRERGSLDGEGRKAILFTSLDRFARHEDWSQGRDQLRDAGVHLFGTVWPPKHMETLVGEDEDEDGQRNLFNASVPRAVKQVILSQQRYATSCSSALPFVLPISLDAGTLSERIEACLESIVRDSVDFVRGLTAGHRQGDPRLEIPACLEPKPMERGGNLAKARILEAELRQILPAGPSLQVINLTAKGVFICRCSQGLCNRGCLCDCTKCEANDRLLCPGRQGSRSTCPEMCICVCNDHHRRETQMGTLEGPGDGGGGGGGGGEGGGGGGGGGG
ncbi:hypothetical protein IE53DRAFT_390657, partial [Violaceomyces palustris]